MVSFLATREIVQIFALFKGETMSGDILNALIGGALIGLSATMMLRLNGKIAGISGIVESSFFSFKSKDSYWKVTFLGGLLLGGLGLVLFYPDSLVNTFEQKFWLVSLGGLLVGFGTRLGSGCTSGHGVCGMSRLSFRSIVATLSFMGAGFLTVLATFHIFNVGDLQ